MRALEFMEACGVVDDPTMAQASLYSSHEGKIGCERHNTVINCVAIARAGAGL